MQPLHEEAVSQTRAPPRCLQFRSSSPHPHPSTSSPPTRPRLDSRTRLKISLPSPHPRFLLLAFSLAQPRAFPLNPAAPLPPPPRLVAARLAGTLAPSDASGGGDRGAPARLGASRGSEACRREEAVRRRRSTSCGRCGSGSCRCRRRWRGRPSRRPPAITTASRRRPGAARSTRGLSSGGHP